MGQIIGGAAKPKRCNLNKLSQLGTPAAGEYILVSSDNSMNAAGQGNFDCYIEGDGTKAATALELKRVDGKLEEELTQLSQDLMGYEGYTPINIGTNTDKIGYFGKNGGALSANQSYRYFVPVDLSEYVGKTLKMEVEWAVAPSSSYDNAICIFTGSKVLNWSDTTAKGYVGEYELYTQKIGNKATLITTIEKPYLRISTHKNSGCTISVKVLTTIEGRVPMLESKAETLEEETDLLKQEVIYDVSANNGEATFASLSALLSSENLSTLIPVAVRCGGMNIRFKTSNKYVQFRYMGTDATTAVTFTNVANWQGVDDAPTAGSENLVKSGGVFDIVGYKNTINNLLPIINHYNSHFEQQQNGPSSYLASSQFVEIPLGKGYALITCVGSNYSYIRLSYYDSSENLISAIKYGDDGVTRFDWGQIYGIGSDIPSAAKYVKAIARTDTVSWSQVMILFADTSSKVNPIYNYLDYYDRNVLDLPLLLTQVEIKPKVDLSASFKVYNYYDNRAETTISNGLSTVKIPIPSWANYFVQSGKPREQYGRLGFNFYDLHDTLILAVRYATEGTTRYLSGDYCGLGFAIPANSAYVRLYSDYNNVLFSDMTAKFYASNSDIVESSDLVFHEYGLGHLKELDEYITNSQADALVSGLEKVIDKNLVKENYYNYNEEKTPSTQRDAVSSVKIYPPSWANYVIVGNTKNYSYIKFLCYDDTDTLIATLLYNSEGVNRHDFWELQTGIYYYIGSEIPAGTSYIRIGYQNIDMFLLETACVKFYKSVDDVPGEYEPNPYRTYEERNILKFNEYVKINNWYYDQQLPDYYFPYLSNKAAEIESYLKTCASNCDVFFFITDTHFDFSRTPLEQLNAGQSFTMMSYLRKYLRIDTILHGGDLMNLPLCGNFMEDYKQVLGTNRVYLALGNHEFISLQDQNAVNYYTRMLSNDMIYGDENKMWGYVDNPTRKSRYIVLSPFGPSPDGTSSYLMDKLNDDNQYNWFVNTALNIPAGYTAVIVSHLLYTFTIAGSPLTLPTPSERYVTAIDNYSGAGRIACVLMGHTHSDRIHIGQTGIPYIISQTDRFYTPGGDRDDIGVTRTRGTITEQHFEVVVINKVAHEIKLFAIGSNSLNGMDDNLGVEVSARTLSNLTNI